MSDNAPKPTNTPEYGCKDITPKKAAKAVPAAKSTNTDKGDKK